MEAIRIFRKKGKSENEVIYKKLRDIEALEEYVNDILTPQERIKLHYHNTAEFIIFATVNNIDSQFIDISHIFHSANKMEIKEELDDLINELEVFLRSGTDLIFLFHIAPEN